MLGRLFPQQFDNRYHGHFLALLILVPVVLMKTAIALSVTGLNPWMGAAEVIERADGVPLSEFGAHATYIIITSFASWGILQLILVSLCYLSLLRYRSMIPLMFLFILLDQFVRLALPGSGDVAPSELSTGFWVNIALLVLVAVGFVLSLLKTSRHEGKAQGDVGQRLD